jgi:ATP-binding cassette, subfamily B, bacterial
VRARSVIPGRQRWDIGLVLAGPRVAESLEAELRGSPGVGVVRANPVTGRLLVYHDTALSSEEVGQLVRKAVRAARQTMARGRPPRPQISVVPAQVRHRQHRQRTARSFAVAGGAVLAVPLVRRLRRSPLVRLGTLLAATVVVVRRAWRRSIRSQQASTASLRHPLLQIVGPYRRQFYVASSLSVLWQLLDTAFVALIGILISVPITGTSATLVRLGLTSASSQLWFWAGVTAFVVVLNVVVAFVAGVLWRNLAQSVQHKWRTEMYTHIQRVELRYLEDERATRLARVLTDDVNQLSRFFAASANDLIQLGTSFVVLTPVFLFFAPGIAWVIFLTVPIIAWLSFFNQEHAAPEYAASSERGSLLNSQLINNLEAITTVKSFVAEDYEIDRIHRLSEAYRQSHRPIDTRTSAYMQTVRGCVTVSFVGFILLGALEVLNGTLVYQVYNILVGMPILILWKLPVLGDAVDQYQQTVAALRRVLDLHGLPVESSESGQRLDVAKAEGEMALEGVTFAYPGRQPVLRNMSLRIASRKTTGIIGVTGAGKTTIAKLLMRFQEVESGRVLLDGQDIRDVKLHDLRRAISFVGQDAFLFDGTVGDNIRYGSFDADPARVMSVARLTEADEFIQAMPLRYDTMIGERGVTLSGGQKQRLSLARAILKSAPILILDEATSALDNETEAAIQRALKDFVSDRTLIIIAHRLSTIRHADWIYVMGRNGVAVEGGTHHELLEREGVYAAMWRLQTGETNS